MDDFIFTGNTNNFIMQNIHQFRQHASTTEPEVNPPLLLGLEIHRDKPRNIVSITMKSRIRDLAALFPEAIRKPRSVPMPPTGYIVDPEDLDALPPAQSRFLNPAQHNVYIYADSRIPHMDSTITHGHHIYNSIPVVVHPPTPPTPFANGLPLHFIPIFHY